MQKNTVFVKRFLLDKNIELCGRMFALLRTSVRTPKRTEGHMSIELCELSCLPQACRPRWPGGGSKLPNETRAKHEWLKTELRIRGTSLSGIGRALGVSSAAMSMVSIGKNRSVQIETAIAQALETPPEQLWPERYKDP